MERRRDRVHEDEPPVLKRKPTNSLERLKALKGAIKTKQVRRSRDTSPLDGSLRIQPIRAAEMGKSVALINTENDRGSMLEDSIMSNDEVDGNGRSKSIKSTDSKLGRLNTLLKSIRGKSKSRMSSQDSKSISPERPLGTVVHESTI